MDTGITAVRAEVADASEMLSSYIDMKSIGLTYGLAGQINCCNIVAYTKEWDDIFDSESEEDEEGEKTPKEETMKSEKTPKEETMEGEKTPKEEKTMEGEKTPKEEKTMTEVEAAPLGARGEAAPLGDEEVESMSEDSMSEDSMYEDSMSEDSMYEDSMSETTVDEGDEGTGFRLLLDQN